MRPITEANRNDIKLAASLPIACRNCGMSEGLVMDMVAGQPVYMAQPPPIVSRFEGSYIPHTCPRCHRTILIPDEDRP